MLTLSISNRIHTFAGDFETSQPALKAFHEYLTSPKSFLNVHRPKEGVFSSLRDGAGDGASRYIEKEKATQANNPFFTFLTAFSNPHTEWSIEALPLSFRTYRDQVSPYLTLNNQDWHAYSGSI